MNPDQRLENNPHGDFSKHWQKVFVSALQSNTPKDVLKLDGLILIINKINTELSAQNEATHQVTSWLSFSIVITKGKIQYSGSVQVNLYIL